MEPEHAFSGCFPALMTPCSSTGVPVVVGTVAQNTAIAVEHARHAKANGAQGLMIIPRVLSRGISPARKVIQTVKDQLDQVRFIDFGMPDQTAGMIVQHTVIFNAIRSGDTEIAVEEMDMHLQEVCEKQLSTKEC